MLGIGGEGYCRCFQVSGHGQHEREAGRVTSVENASTLGSRASSRRWRTRGVVAALVYGREHVDRLVQHRTAVDAVVAGVSSGSSTCPSQRLVAGRVHAGAPTYGAAHPPDRCGVNPSEVEPVRRPSSRFFAGTEGIIRGPVGKGRVSLGARDDIADATTVVLTADGHDDRTYDMTGPEALSLAETAEVLSRVAGQPISHPRRPSRGRGNRDEVVFGHLRSGTEGKFANKGETMIREFADGATVESPDGESLGKIDRFVIDPSSREVTHLVIRKGVFFPEDRVVPMGMVARIDNGNPVLADQVELEELPQFEVDHYVPVDSATRDRFDDPLGEASMWRYPMAGQGMYPAYPAYPPTDPALSNVKERNVPDSSVVINDGTDVRTPEGDSIGSVAEVTTDDDGRLNHLVVDLGFLSGHRVLPAHWIEAIRDDAITVAVAEEALSGLDEWRT